MTKPHITNPRDRKTKKYAALHAQLVQETFYPDRNVDKSERKRAKSEDFRTHGAE